MNCTIDLKNALSCYSAGCRLSRQSLRSPLITPAKHRSVVLHQVPKNLNIQDIQSFLSVNYTDSVSILAQGQPYGLGICCIYIEKHIYIIDTMLHKKGGKGGQCCRELHQTISLTRNDAPQSLRAGDRERESDTADKHHIQ